MSNFKIESIVAREVLDSRGFPTVEVDLTASSNSSQTKSPQLAGARAITPSGASTGEGEALELRDGDAKRYLGKGTLKAVSNVKNTLAPALVGKSFSSQRDLDEALLRLDGTPNKTQLGANALLPVSMAFARATAELQNLWTYEWIAKLFGKEGVTLPIPLMNILNGGKHADNGLAIQEFMVVPSGFSRFSEALRAGAEVFHHLKKILHKQGLSTGVGDEGGFAPRFAEAKNSHEKTIEVILSAISAAGYQPGRDVFLALDCAASEFGNDKDGYLFEGEKRTSAEMVDLYSQWTQKYPILSIEDGLSEHDWSGWKLLTQKCGSKVQLVGDDIFVTNKSFLQKGIDTGVGNAILIKLNQIGTLTETLDTMKLASEHRYSCISSHRSGESEDTFISELAVGTDCGQIKTGSASRTDRIAKYNQLLRIEEKLGARARFGGNR